ncbi:MAG: hypothetical protein Q4A54_06660 [Parabacteroides sp.]|nr:hypothetical protein [Parabacteroides sp.]
MENFRNTKDRLLSMHARLVEGKVLYKAEEAKRYGCSLRSIQRDIDDLRSFFFDKSEFDDITQELIYDKKLNAYRLDPPLRNVLTNQEKQDEKGYLVQAEVFGKGLDMWLRSQGDWLEIQE